MEVKTSPDFDTVICPLTLLLNTSISINGSPSGSTPATCPDLTSKETDSLLIA